eukprot:Hpha_TRINITY_DN22986_c0_g1::TRINITY_DN22986_c0_g1_i1::g.154137::m.154137
MKRLAAARPRRPQTRGMSDEAASMWLRHLKPDSLGRRDGDQLEARQVGALVEKELEVLRSGGWDLGPLAYSTAVSVVARYGDAAAAQRIFDGMKAAGVPPGIRACNSLMNSYANSGDLEGFRTAYRTTRRECVEAPDAVTSTVVLSALHRLKCPLPELWAAVATFEREGLGVQRQGWNSVVAASRNWEEAQRTLATMRERCVLPDLISYGAALKACGKSKDTAGAEEVWASVQELGLRPTVREWTGRLAVYMRCGNTRGARRVWREMREASVQPNSVSYGTMISVSANAEEVSDLFDEAVTTSNANSSRLHTLAMQAASRGRDPYLAARVLAHSRSLGLPEEPKFQRYWERASADSEVSSS